MPIVDRTTGRRLSGAAQRKLAALRRQPAEQPEPAKAKPTRKPEPEPVKPHPAGPSCPRHPALDALAPPPLGNIADTEAWATGAAVAVALAGRTGGDAGRLRVLRKALKALGSVRDKARRSQKAAELLKLRRGEVHDLVSDKPPASALCAVAWAFYALASLTHAIATAANPHALADEVENLATIGYVPGKEAIDRLCAELERG